jgi:hypothetical protein
MICELLVQHLSRLGGISFEKDEQVDRSCSVYVVLDPFTKSVELYGVGYQDENGI